MEELDLRELVELVRHFDFAGVILPVGFDAEHTVFFNKEDIERVIFLGYIDVDF